MAAQKHILILDGSRNGADELLESLNQGDNGFKVNHASDIATGLNLINSAPPDLVLADGSFTETKEFLDVKAKLEGGHIPLILLSDVTGTEIISQAERAGATEYLIKNRITPFYLLKTILSTLKLAEAENQLDSVFEEYGGRIESFSKILDAIEPGIFVVAVDGETLYANAAASAYLEDSVYGKKIQGFLTYREREEEEKIEIKAGKKIDITILGQNFVWNGTAANLFIVTVAETKATVPSFPVYDIAGNILNAVEADIVLLKGSTVEFINAGAAKVFEKYRVQGLQDKVVELLANNPGDFEQVVELQGGAKLELKFFIKNLNISSDAYKLAQFVVSEYQEKGSVLGFEPAEPAEPTNAAARRMDGPVRNVVNDVYRIIDDLNKGEFNNALQQTTLAQAELKKVEGFLLAFSNYAALDSYTLHITDLPMKELVDEVIADFKKEIVAGDIEINISELPVEKGDRILVVRLLENLVSNAMAFSRPNRKPVIDIGHDKFDGEIIFCVRDNGVGISRKDHQRIFEPFETLESAGGTDGKGLGLAICKKIVERHNGKIWVESLPGHGSNFYFTLGNKAKTK